MRLPQCKSISSHGENRGIRPGSLLPRQPSSTGSLSGHVRLQSRRAELCKQYLRTKHIDKLPEVEAFAVEVERSENHRDFSKWDLFIDLQDIYDEVLKRLDLEFEIWLQPQ